MVLAALYGGLGLGVPSSDKFDYANSLNTKIQSAGGYGIPPGIYSYAFDPSTGMPFMCDPTKTPPGGSKSQAAGAAAINPPAANKPVADEPPVNVPSDVAPSASVASQDAHPSITEDKTASLPGTNTVDNNKTPEHRLSPIEQTPLTHKVQDDTPAVSNDSPTTGKQLSPSSGKEDDLMTSSLPNNKVNDGVTPTPEQHKTTSSASKIETTEHLFSKPSGVTPIQQSNGVAIENHVSNDNQPSRDKSSSHAPKVMVGPPLYINNPKSSSNSNNKVTSNKVTSEKLTPLIDNYHKEMKLSKEVKVKRSNNLKKYFERKKTLKKNDITIKLPEIPPCPDMKNYHWPWNCLGEFNSNTLVCYPPQTIKR